MWPIIDYHATNKHGDLPIINDFCTEHFLSIAWLPSPKFPDPLLGRGTAVADPENSGREGGGQETRNINDFDFDG